jgi:hypothetical protein
LVDWYPVVLPNEPAAAKIAHILPILLYGLGDSIQALYPRKSLT